MTVTSEKWAVNNDNCWDWNKNVVDSFYNFGFYFTSEKLLLKRPYKEF